MTQSTHLEELAGVGHLHTGQVALRDSNCSLARLLLHEPDEAIALAFQGLRICGHFDRFHCSKLLEHRMQVLAGERLVEARHAQVALKVRVVREIFTLRMSRSIRRRKDGHARLGVVRRRCPRERLIVDLAQRLYEWQEPALSILPVGLGELEVAHLFRGDPHVNTVRKLHSRRVERLLLVTLDLYLTLNVQVLEDLDEVRIRQLGVLRYVIDEAIELFWCIIHLVTQADVSHVGPRG